mgnify:CR=1 FL=1
MRVLVDTSVWAAYFRGASDLPAMDWYIEEDLVVTNGIDRVSVPDLIVAQQAMQCRLSLFTLDKHFRLMKPPHAAQRSMSDATNLLLVYDRISGGHNQPPPAGDSNGVWAMRVTVERPASGRSGTIAHEGRADPTTETLAWTYAAGGGGGYDAALIKAMDVHCDYHIR